MGNIQMLLSHFYFYTLWQWFSKLAVNQNHL